MSPASLQSVSRSGRDVEMTKGEGGNAGRDQGAFASIGEGVGRKFISLVEAASRRPLSALFFLGGTYGLMRLKRVGPILQKFFYLSTAGFGGYYLGTAGMNLLFALASGEAGERKDHFIRTGEALLPLGFCAMGLLGGYPREATTRDEWALAVTIFDKFDDLLILGNFFETVKY